MSTCDPVPLGLLGPGTGVSCLEDVVPLPHGGGHVRAGRQMLAHHHCERLVHARDRGGVGRGPVGPFHPVAMGTEATSHANLTLDDASGVAIGVDVTGRGGEDLDDLVPDEA